ncbi:chloramphenicol acetyltransferase [Flavobacterium caeni]|uniref:Chloramphenicol O-acetyltransferase type A n=1 Tax=Flavobacterium caeni TaxID=490189 RepID=A0A1G5DZX4_9FLAO|nr:chloramphenicol acetyltransferase [Flavobacterium caeni]SCY20289.1 chloramphenicol O-acetyltransferase type A [Flavobacterium caeni]
MKTYLDLDTWPRTEHFHFFRQFDEPFWGAVVEVDCTRAYENAKAHNVPFFIWYLHQTLTAVNAIEACRYRIEDQQVAVYDRVDVSATIMREDGSFGFSYMKYHQDIAVFSKRCLTEIDRVKNTPGLFTRTFDMANLIHFSAVPWVNFTSLSHARSFSFPDSCPKISFGKMTVHPDGKRTMPMSVHVHHALMDGLHVGQLIDRFQAEMNR